MNQEDIILKVQKVIREVVVKESPSVDKEAKWPENSIRALQNEGLMGLVISTKYGGLGQGLVGLIKVCETLATCCPSTAMCFGMHCVGSAVIQAKATPAQAEKFLEPILKGKHITTLALSEPGTGAHFYFPQTKLSSDGKNNFIVNGKKTFVTNGGHADSYVLSTVGVEPGNPNQFSCIVVEANGNNLEWGAPWNGIGMRGNSSRSVELNNLMIPSGNLLGEKGDQLWFVFNVVAPYFLMAMAGTYLGIAQSAFDEAKAHLISRTYSHSGKSLNEQSILQHRVGVLYSKIERTRKLMYAAAYEGDKGEETAIPLILSSKAEVAHCAVDVVNESMTLMGGIGYRENSKMERLLRDARASHVMSPTTDLLYTWIGRALLDQPILGD